MHFAPLIPTVMMLPALFQMHGVRVGTPASLPVETEAEAFMSSYGDDIRKGRRKAIVDRYDRRGAYRVGEGEKALESWNLIQAAYLTQWSQPSSFAWRELSFETVNDDAVVVIGLFDWGLADGRKLSFSYTALLVRQAGELKIRLEDESMNPRALAALSASSQKN
jgi:hypothetical protein